MASRLRLEPLDMVGYANNLLRGWPETINQAMRPEEGLTRVFVEQKEVTLKCVYPDPDDGVSFSWVKVEEEGNDSYGGTK
tara:strand:- start:656 stop:895 length:240 start_codon:yes stop_codon:yes gene_type:complete